MNSEQKRILTVAAYIFLAGMTLAAIMGIYSAYLTLFYFVADSLTIGEMFLLLSAIFYLTGKFLLSACADFMNSALKSLRKG